MQILYALLQSSMRLQRNVALVVVPLWATQTSPGIRVHSIRHLGYFGEKVGRSRCNKKTMDFEVR